MKRLLISLCVLGLVGWGCPSPAPATPGEKVEAYTNAQYGFVFDYPVERMEVRDRPDDENRRSPYVGIDTDFFMSVRDLTPKANGAFINIVNFHAVKDLEVAAFVRALDKEPGVEIVSEESVTMGQGPMTKIVSTTQAGIDKYHYLFETKDSIVVISIALAEQSNFESVLQTFRFVSE